MKELSYTELKQAITDAPDTYLPALVQHIIKTCAMKPIYVDKEAMLGFVNIAWDSALEPRQA